MTKNYFDNISVEWNDHEKLCMNDFNYVIGSLFTNVIEQQQQR